MRHRHRRALDLLCGAAGGEPHPDDRSKLIDGVAWHRPVSGEMHTRHSQEETCKQHGDHCDLHSAGTKHTKMIQGLRYVGTVDTTALTAKHPPSKLTRAVYPAASLMLGSAPFWTKDLTLSRSPSIAADQIPDHNTDQSLMKGKILTVRAFTEGKYKYIYIL